ncbi:hypothetical protein Nepgr_027415 [Nepenthes gracilis]|uniref:Uncharacterized protein n=1 Tax=Nepenthes gracilis TaxID=150966 RepID=A0AAD3Y180_NEPGR|nr:hypothetical protein Nepgr_027415 [Nepenthes gracilis]
MEASVSVLLDNAIIPWICCLDCAWESELPLLLLFIRLGGVNLWKWFMMLETELYLWNRRYVEQLNLAVPTIIRIAEISFWSEVLTKEEISDKELLEENVYSFGALLLEIIMAKSLSKEAASAAEYSTVREKQSSLVDPSLKSLQKKALLIWTKVLWEVNRKNLRHRLGKVKRGGGVLTEGKENQRRNKGKRKAVNHHQAEASAEYLPGSSIHTIVAPLVAQAAFQ